MLHGQKCQPGSKFYTMEQYCILKHTPYPMSKCTGKQTKVIKVVTPVKMGEQTIPIPFKMTVKNEEHTQFQSQKH